LKQSVQVSVFSEASPQTVEFLAWARRHLAGIFGVRSALPERFQRSFAGRVPARPGEDTIHHSQFTIHHSQFTIHHSQFTIHNSQFTIHHSQFTIRHHSQFTIHNSQSATTTIHQSPQALRNSFAFKDRIRIM